MKFLPAWLSQLIGDSHFDATVERIVRFTEEPTWQRVMTTGLTLEPFALRGYLRARTALIVQRQVAAEISSQRVSDKFRLRLTEAAADLLIRNLMGRLVVCRAEVESSRRAA